MGSMAIGQNLPSSPDRRPRLIDLHSHVLPGIDDGAPDLATSLEMARMAVADGIRVMACTPHIYPGLYENTGPDILMRVAALQAQLDAHGIALRLVAGADTHLVPGLVEGVRTGHIPTLGATRYLLLEPPHHVEPPRFAQSLFELLAAGIVPLITHPERLSWVEQRYDAFVDAVSSGALLQVTGGALTGRFGPRAQYWAHRMLEDGIVAVLASDAHGVGRRCPQLAQARDAAAALVGADEAGRLVEARPAAILADASPADLPPVQRMAMPTPAPLWRRWFGA